MGKKPARQRQRILFYLTCGLIILLLCGGCSWVEERRRQIQTDARVDREKKQLERRHSTHAVGEQEKTLTFFPGPIPADRILYELGMFMTDPDNPEQNYSQAFDRFQQLITMFPDSEYRKAAEAWSSIISAYVDLDHQLKKSELKIKLLQKKIFQKEKEIETLREQRNKMKQIDLELNKNRELTSPGAQ